jgi:hypothetical protein
MSAKNLTIPRINTKRNAIFATLRAVSALGFCDIKPSTDEVRSKTAQPATHFLFEFQCGFGLALAIIRVAIQHPMTSKITSSTALI